MPNLILKRFMVFNPNEGQHEGTEHDKLLYHWNKGADNNRIELNEQIDDVCLCDASVTASIRLNSKPNCDANSQPSLESQSETSKNDNFKLDKRTLVLTFESTLIFIIEIEPKQSIWIAVHVSQASSTNQNDATSISSSGKSQQQADLTNSVPVAAIERVAINIYTRFCLLNGTFRMIADEAVSSETHDDKRNLDDTTRKMISRNRIRSICEQYFDVVLPEIHLNSIIANIASLYNYIVYLDLNPMTLMKVNSFINHLVCTGPGQIRHTIAIFNDQLVWSSLNMYDSRLIYNFLVAVLIRDALQEELSKETDKVRAIKLEMPIYLTDRPDEQNNLDESISTDAIVMKGREPGLDSTNKILSKFYLTVFRSSNNMTLGLILKDPNQNDLIQRCERILTSDSRLGVIPLASLAQTVGQNFLRANSHNMSLVQSSSSTLQGNSSGSGRPSAGNLSLKGPTDQKYLCVNKLNVSVNWSPSVDASSKDHQQMIGSLDSTSQDASPANKKVQLIKQLLELDPEFEKIKRQSGSMVEEFFAKTTNDSWLTVTNSRYKSIYSTQRTRNASLSEAQQDAFNLKSALTNDRP